MCNLKTLDQASLYLEAITTPNQQSLGSLLQTLIVHDIFLPEGISNQEEVFFTSLAKHCPNVKRIQAREVSDDFCERLREEHQNGHFQLLEQIPECGDIEAYVEVVLELSNMLTHLLLCDSLERSNGDPLIISYNDISELSNSLDNFPRLSQLEIRHHTSSGIFAYDEYFQRCPVLKTINYTAFDIDVETHIAMELGYYEDYMAQEDDLRMDIVDLSTIQPRPDIKHFTGSFVLYTDETIKYFIFKFQI